MLDIDLAVALGMTTPRKIRQNIIEANEVELQGLGDLRMEVIQTGGRPSTAYYLNEEQALLVCMFSRTANAQVVRKQVIETFMQVRRGVIQLALPDFTNPAAAARAWADEVEQRQALQIENQRLLPMAKIGERSRCRSYEGCSFGEGLRSWGCEAELTGFINLPQHNTTSLPDGLQQQH